MKFMRMLPVLGLLLTLAAVQDEEKVKLEVKFKKGDKVTVKESSQNEGTMTMTVAMSAIQAGWTFEKSALSTSPTRVS